jgi:hypothetical protein
MYGLGFDVPYLVFLFIPTIFLDSFLTILCKISISSLSFSMFYLVFLPGGHVNKSPLLDIYCVYFFDKEI